VAGCPPRPEALIHGIITLHEKVRGGEAEDGPDMPTIRESNCLPCKNVSKPGHVIYALIQDY